MLEFYPSITAEQFAEGCQSLERRCHDNLDGTTWLSVSWTGRELQIKERRQYQPNLSVSKSLEERKRDSTSDSAAVESTIVDLDEDDATINRSQARDGALNISFSITLSPTWSVPVLWIDAPGLASLEELYAVLAPPHLQDALRDIGVLGGISRAYHPFNDRPSHFVHPCNTHDALRAVHTGRSLTTEGYLLLWLGIVGSAVGLHIPSKLVEDLEGSEFVAI